MRKVLLESNLGVSLTRANAGELGLKFIIGAIGVVVMGSVIAPSSFGLAVFALLALMVVPLSVLALVHRQRGTLALLGTLMFIDLFKRLIFWQPDSASRTLMYTILLLPDLLFGALVLNLLHGLLISHRIRWKWSSVDALAMGFFALCTFSSFSNPVVPLSAKVAAFERQAMPILMFFIGAQTLSSIFALRGARKVIVLGGLLVAIYAVQQFTLGFTSFERNWFEATREYSIAASNIAVNLEWFGYFRGFATLPDHVSLGLLMGLCISMLWLIKDRELPGIIIIPVTLTLGLALLVSFTRLAYLALVLTAIIYWLLSWRPMRQPLGITLTIALVPFPIVVLFQRLYTSGLLATQNPYLSRIFDTGTLSARLAWAEQLPEAIRRGGLLGQGLAYTPLIGPKFGLVVESLYSHNMLIDLIEQLGLLGLLLFLLFTYRLFARSFRLIGTAEPRRARDALRLLTAVIMSWIVVGHINYAVFFSGPLLSYLFWGLCGAVAHFHASQPALRVASESWERPIQSSTPL